ncbi:MAG TPA: hypothetical protein VHT92_10145 [Candidatus Cybelea sp.]|jgi:hypothetical protein|nr:hypothetical protein [Candidatus Cybelea sp.]
MTSSTALLPSVRAAFGALIDYAGLFPPARLPLAEAFAEYGAARQGPHAWMLGRFIVPASALPVASDAALSVVVEPSAEAFELVARQRKSSPRIETIEVPLNQSVAPFREQLSTAERLDVLGALEADLAVNGLRDVTAFVEIPRARPWWSALSDTMGVLARLKFGAKLRCGGLSAEAFPSIDEVAAFIAAAAAAGVPFKATAGLHHPVRHLDESTGFTMHGFLNVLAAAAFASQVDEATLREIVGEEEKSAFTFASDSFAWRDRRINVAELQATRHSAFVAYGSCSFAEPVADLTAMGLLPCG